MTTYHINADSGNDSTGNGSSGNPWQTLAHAYNNSTIGDTIQCQDSTAAYEWQTIVFSTGRTIIGNTTAPSSVVFDGLETHRYWMFNTGGDTDISGIRFTRSWKLTNAHEGQIYIKGSAAVSLDNCIFDNIKTGLSLARRGGLFGGQTTTGSGPLDNSSITVSNSLIKGIAYDGVSAYKALMGTQSFISWSWNLYNNVFDMSDQGTNIDNFIYEVSSTSATLMAKNNIFYNRIGQVIDFVNGLTSTTFDNNGYYATAAGGWTDVPSGSGNVTSDPLFVDIENGNYNLRPSSPLIGAGVLV